MCVLEVRRQLGTDWSVFEHESPKVQVFVTENGQKNTVTGDEYKSGKYSGNVTGLRYGTIIMTKTSGYGRSSNFLCEIYCEDKKCVIDRFGQVFLGNSDESDDKESD